MVKHLDDRCIDVKAKVLYSLIEKREEDMKRLEGFQKMHLRAIAHGLNPIVFIGQKGLTNELIQSANQALQRHELITIALR